MAAKTNEYNKESLYKILISPVVLLIPIMGITAAFGRGGGFYQFHPYFVTGVVCLYIMMSITYAMLSRKKSFTAVTATSAVANGTSIIFFSILFRDGVLFTAIGFFVLMAGMMMIISSVAPKSESLFAMKIDAIV
jgi:hypothetical protein